MINRIISCVGFFLFYSSVLFSQEASIIVTIGVAYMNENSTLEETKRRAFNIARSEAIRKTVGVIVYEDTYRSKGEVGVNGNSQVFDTFSRINKETSSGRIINEKILNENTFVENGRIGYRIEIEAEVVKEDGEADPFYNAEIKTSKDVFFVDENGKGENISFAIKASKDCYIYLFSLTTDDSVKLLIPNDYLRNNYYSIQPGKNDFIKLVQELEFTVELPKGKQLVYEALCLIALKERHDFSYGKNVNSSNQFIGTYKAAYIDIQNWLISIPRDQRTEAFVSYEIRRKK